MNKTFLLSLFGIAVCLLSVSSYAADAVCHPAWEYKVIHVDHADAAVVRGKANVTQAAGSFESRLNGLGARGWEIASDHKLVVNKVFDLEKSKGWTVRLEPAAVLLKRRSGCAV